MSDDANPPSVADFEAKRRARNLVPLSTLAVRVETLRQDFTAILDATQGALPQLDAQQHLQLQVGLTKVSDGAHILTELLNGCFNRDGS